MKYRIFGKTGEKVSVLGYGNMRLPVVNNDYGHVDVNVAMKLVRHAIDNGVNYLDTSWPYHSGGFTGGDIRAGGSSEPFVGQVLKAVGRDKVFVASKLPIWLVETRADMDDFLENQLKRLGTDYLDFYLVHSINRPNWTRMMNLGLASFLDSIQKSGKVRHVGFSFHDTPRLFQEVIDYYPFSFCQHVVNYYDTHFQAGLGLLRQAARRGMGIVAMEPVMGGVLGDRLPQKAKDELAKGGRNWSPAGWCLRWVWNQPAVSLALSGMHNMEQLEENLKLADESDIPLTLEELRIIGKTLNILHEKDEIPCSQCDFCECPYGVAIKDNFTIYNANLNLDVITISDKCYDVMLRNSGMEADKCNDCGQCAYECPRGIDIPNELRKVAMYFASHKAGFEWH
ncbi:MAG: aldo/keto reductase [Desulfovibrio sp.]|nr:aldo/keto reductase [Desulfovibrio sp.]